MTDEQPEVDLTGLMAQMEADDAAYRNSLTYQQRFNAAEQQSAAMQQMQIARDYGEQFPVAECTCQGLPHWCDACLSKRRESRYGEQCADTDGLAAEFDKQIAEQRVAAVAQRGAQAIGGIAGLSDEEFELAMAGKLPAGYTDSVAQRGCMAETLGGFGQYLSEDLQGAYASELQRLDAPPQPRGGLAPDSPLWLIEKLYARIDTLTARAEQAERNAEVAIRDRDKALAELAQRMAIPSNALKHGGIR